jgi:hypothetical protein
VPIRSTLSQVRMSIATCCVAALALSAAAMARPQAQNVHGALYGAAPSSMRVTGVVLVFSRSGREVGRSRTSAGGHFALRLGPGVYTVRAVRKPRLTPSRFRVPEIGVVVLTLRLAAAR